MLVSVGGTQREKNRTPQNCDRRSVVFLNLFCQEKLVGRVLGLGALGFGLWLWAL